MDGLQRIKLGICSVCSEESPAGKIPPERFIVNKSKNLCDYHNKKRKAKPLKKKPRKKTGEAELFKKIWEELEPEQRVSFVTGFLLPDIHEMRTYYFSHVLSKGAYPELRTNRDNIVLMTLKEHQLWEFEKDKIKNNPMWEKVFLRRKELLEKLKKKPWKIRQ